MFTPNLRGNDPIWRLHIFQIGWFNHQPAMMLKILLLRNSTSEGTSMVKSSTFAGRLSQDEYDTLFTESLVGEDSTRWWVPHKMSTTLMIWKFPPILKPQQHHFHQRHAGNYLVFFYHQVPAPWDQVTKKQLSVSPGGCVKWLYGVIKLDCKLGHGWLFGGNSRKVIVYCLGFPLRIPFIFGDFIWIHTHQCYHIEPTMPTLQVMPDAPRTDREAKNHREEALPEDGQSHLASSFGVKFFQKPRAEVGLAAGFFFRCLLGSYPWKWS